MTDADLAARAHRGDRAAFGDLVARYANQARRVALAVLGNSDDADDAAQDAFLSALQALDRYDPDRPFGPWLMRIVANAATDRQRRRRVRQVEPVPPETATDEPGPAELADRDAFMTAVRAALGQLPHRQRAAVVLFDAEGYSHAEIAEMLGVPVGTVRSDVFHGRRALRARLGPWQRWME